MFEFNLFFYFFILCVILSIIVCFFSFFLVIQRRDLEKETPYECGFQPFSDSMINFEIKFYLIGIIFLLFDLEIVFIYPWLLFTPILNIKLFICFLFFFFFLLLSFFSEFFFGIVKW